jgi:hypothetical protein
MKGDHPILDIFFCEKKSELRGLAKKAVISLSQLDQVIMACECRRLCWTHDISFREFLPEDIDLANATAMTPEGRRTYEQILAKRRYLVGHIFFTEDRRNWHFMYFDQRDLSKSRNHWAAGPHLHLINYLWPNWTAEKIWTEFNKENPAMSNAVHIRFFDDVLRG